MQLKLLSLDGRGRERVEKIGNKMVSFINPGFPLPQPLPQVEGRVKARVK
jgi:hypothetical protein